MAVVSKSYALSFSSETFKDQDVSATFLDATACVITLYDSTNTEILGTIQATSSSNIRVSFEAVTTGTFYLVVSGSQAIATVTSTDTGAIPGTAPTLEMYGTYEEFREKLENDLDLQDETFITTDEMIGYFNEGIEEAESEIHKIDEEYFLSNAPLPIVEDEDEYEYPRNIYGMKVRGIVYQNGSVIYPIHRMKRLNKFTNVAMAEEFAATEDYRWYPINRQAGQPRIMLVPAARETAILAPEESAFTPIKIWFIRRANRIPKMGEYVLDWEIFDSGNDVDISTSKFLIESTYVTGDAVKLTSSGTVPGGLTASTVYYVIAGSGFIKLATSLANARAGTAISLTSTGSGAISLAIAATQAIIDATIIDIPEFGKFVLQWVKCRCMEKEGDPRLSGAAQTLEQQRAQMVATLADAQPDDESELTGDMSAYFEMS